MDGWGTRRWISAVVVGCMMLAAVAAHPGRGTVAIRAADVCNVNSPYAVAELTTTRQFFTQLSGCFIATAAYGSALQPQVAAMRQARDALRARSPLFAAVADIYGREGPAAAAVVGTSDTARAAVRAALAPAAALAEAAISVRFSR